VPVFANKTYNIPYFVDEKTLAIISSYSGDTEETIEAYRQAKSRGARIVIITSGGELGRLNEKKVLIPKGMPPRCSLGYQFFAMLAVLQNSKIIPDQRKYINETISLLKGFDTSKARELARKLHGKIPIIYGSDAYSSVVYRWQTQLNETSKMFALSNVFPEMNHNEISAHSKSGNFEAVLLRDGHDHERIKKRMNITKRVMAGVLPVNDVHVRGKSMLSRMFYAIHFGDWVSCFLADMNGVDPKATPEIEYLKEELKKTRH
jgi:glucose/mannose-6-phosphate isomerase